MFKELFKRIADGDTITIAMTRKDELLTVSLLPSHKIKNVKPLIITGSPDELDGAFVAAVANVMEKAMETVASVANTTVHNEDEVTESIADAVKKPLPTKKTANNSTEQKITAKDAPKEKPKPDPIAALTEKVEVMVKKKLFREAIDAITEVEKIAKGDDLKKVKALKFDTQVAKMKVEEMFDEQDESDDVVIPKKIEPNPATKQPEPQQEEVEDEEEEFPETDSNDEEF